MKLHLTATSERGKPVTKSGNEIISMYIKNEARETIAELVIQDGYFRFWTNGSLKEWNEPKTVNLCTDGKPHRYDSEGSCTGEDCFMYQQEPKTAREVIHESDIIRNDDGDEVEQ